MKTKFNRNIILICLLSFTTFFSCTNDSGELAIENQAQLKVSDNAFLSDLGNQTINGAISIKIAPSSNSSINYNQSILLPFYNLSVDNNDDWIPIPSIQKEKNLKIYFTRQDDSKINIIIEKLEGSEPFENTIELKNFNVVAIKASALKGLNRNELDLREYTQIVEYFNLK